MAKIDTTTKFITVDTNLYDNQKIIELGRGLPYIHLFSSAITTTELGFEVILGETHDGGMFGSTMIGDYRPIPNKPIPKVFTIGVSAIGGEDIIPSDDGDTNLLTRILDIATNGSYQYPRDISTGNANQLNDALILQAHFNANHHILLTEDKKFFGDKPSSPLRTELEKLCNTKIMLKDEFIGVYSKHIRKNSYIHSIEELPSKDSSQKIYFPQKNK